MYLVTYKIVFAVLLGMIVWVFCKMIRERKRNIISKEVKSSKRRLFW